MPRATNTSEKQERQGAAPDPTMALSAAIAAFDEEFEKLTLKGKIATISGFLGRVPKNGHNKFNNYDYVLESDLVEHVRYWLAAARILIHQSVKEWHVSEREATSNRSGDPRTDVLYTFVVTDGRTGDEFTFDMLGQGSDPRDKGANKASTSAMKFAYLRLFNIASGEDESEADEHGDARQAAGAPVPVTVTAGTVPDGEVQRGGKQTKATGAQIKIVSNLSNQLSLGAVGLVGVIKRVLDVTIDLGDDETQHAPILATFLKDRSGEDVGKLIYTLQEMVKALPDGTAPYGD